ncbi:MAG: hypothetical protein ACE5D2_08165, partial [Fidelibacterota bacterium]
PAPPEKVPAKAGGAVKPESPGETPVKAQGASPLPIEPDTPDKEQKKLFQSVFDEIITRYKEDKKSLYNENGTYYTLSTERNNLNRDEFFANIKIPWLDAEFSVRIPTNERQFKDFVKTRGRITTIFSKRSTTDVKEKGKTVPSRYHNELYDSTPEAYQKRVKESYLAIQKWPAQIAKLEKEIADLPDNNLRVDKVKHLQKQIKDIQSGLERARKTLQSFGFNPDLTIELGFLGITPQNMRLLYDGLISVGKFTFKDLPAQLRLEARRHGINTDNFAEKFRDYSEKLGRKIKEWFRKVWEYMKNLWNSEEGFIRFGRKLDKNKLLARAHILQKEYNISDKEAGELKQLLFGQETLKGLKPEQINEYIERLKDKDPNKPEVETGIQSARDYLARKIIDLPGRVVSDPHKHSFVDREIGAEARRSKLLKPKPLKKGKVRRFVRNFSGTERYFETAQRRTEVPLYDKSEDLINRYHDYRIVVQTYREKIYPEARHLKEEDGQVIKAWLTGADVELTEPQQKVANAIKDYYNDPFIQTVTKVNRFQQWYKNPGDFPLPGVDKADLENLKAVYEDEGPEALINAIKDVDGFVREKYAPDILDTASADPEFIGIGKGLLKSKEKQGTKGDAIEDYLRKVRSDFKILFLDEPLMDMVDMLGDPRLPDNVKKDTELFLKNLNKLPQEGAIDNLLESGISAIVKPALTTLRAWMRNFPQRLFVVGYARTLDMPRVLWKVLRTTFRPGGVLKVQKNKTFTNAPDHVKRYFLSRVSELLSLEQELLGMRKTPWLDAMGKFGDLIRPIFGFYGGVDTTSRWADFWTVYTEVKKQLNSGKGFKQIRERIFWHEVPRELRKILRAELDVGNKEYVALRIAENMATIKTQFRYGNFEKSIHEQSPLGHAVLRVTTFPRSWTQNRIDDAKIFYEGVKTGDVKKATSGLKALIASVLLAYVLSKKYMENFYGKGSYYSKSYNPLMMGEMDIGSLLGEVLSWTEVPSNTISDVNTLITGLVDGDLSDSEVEKLVKRMARRLAYAGDKISYQTIVGYRQVLWALEAVLNKERIRPLVMIYGKIVDKKRYNPKNIERDAVNKIRRGLFGSEEKKPRKVKYARKTLQSAKLQ